MGWGYVWGSCQSREDIWTEKYVDDDSHSGLDYHTLMAAVWLCYTVLCSGFSFHDTNSEGFVHISLRNNSLLSIIYLWYHYLLLRFAFRYNHIVFLGYKFMSLCKPMRITKLYPLCS
jgi:hypothetical protein